MRAINNQYDQMLDTGEDEMLNYYVVDIADFEMATANMTEREYYIYSRLQQVYIKNQGPICAEEISIFFEKVNIKTAKNRQLFEKILKTFYKKIDEKWCNEELDEQIEKMRNNKERARRAGKASAEARRLKNTDGIEPKNGLKSSATSSTPSSTRSPTNNKNKDKDKNKGINPTQKNLKKTPAPSADQTDQNLTGPESEPDQNPEPVQGSLIDNNSQLTLVASNPSNVAKFPAIRKTNPPDVTSELETAFEIFYSAGLVKKARRCAEKAFSKAAADENDKIAFANYLANDIKKRIAACQTGIDKLHPATYLNGERWTDEITTQNFNGGFNNGQRRETSREITERQTQEVLAELYGEGTTFVDQ